MDNGWIKLHRKFLDWEWFDKADMVHLFLYLLLSANHADQKWRGITIKRGQLVTSLASISAKTHLSIQRIRTCLNRLKSTHEITSKSTSKYTIITICNYDSYQGKEKESNKPNNKASSKRATNEQQTSNKRATNEQQTSNKRATTNKNVKNVKNVKKEVTPKNSAESISSKFVINKDWAEVVFDWLEYKKERRETYKSDRSIKSFITKLRNLSGDDPAVAREIVEQSFANNYAGVFGLKKQITNGKDRRDSETAIREQQIMQLAREAGMA